MISNLSDEIQARLAEIESAMKAPDYAERRQQWRDRLNQSKINHVCSFLPAEIASKIKAAWFNKTGSSVELAFRAHKNMLELKKKLVHLYGQIGTGKTLAACYLAAKIVLNELGPFSELFYLGTKSLEVSLGADLRIHNAQVTGVLILDDLGYETPQARKKTEAIIYHRYDYASGITISTANVEMMHLTKFYSQRCVDRLMEIGVQAAFVERLREGLTEGHR